MTDRAAIDRQDAAARHLARAEQTERHGIRWARARPTELRWTRISPRRPRARLRRCASGVRARPGVRGRGGQAEVEAARPPAETAQKRVGAEQRRAARLESLGSFGLRLLLVLTSLGVSFALLGRLRAAGSRYLPLGLAAVAFSSVFALVMAGDYVTDYVDPLVGPLVSQRSGSA